MPRSMRPLGGSPFKAIGKPLMLGSLLVLSASCSGKEEPSANTAAVTAGGGDSGSATSSPSSSSQAASVQSGAGGATSVTAVTSGTTNAGGSGAVTSSTADVTASTTTSTSSDSSSTGHGSPRTGGAVTIDGPQILVQGEPLHLRGVNWNPVPKGGTHPQDLAYAEFAAEDIALMQAAGINAVRTYEPLTDPAVLDALAAAGIFVLNTVYPYGGNAVDSVYAPVNSSKVHPAILMWVISY